MIYMYRPEFGFISGLSQSVEMVCNLQSDPIPAVLQEFLQCCTGFLTSP